MDFWPEQVETMSFYDVTVIGRRSFMVVGGGDERWARFRTNWCNRDSHALLVGLGNVTATLEDSLAVSHKTISILLLSSQ